MLFRIVIIKSQKIQNSNHSLLFSKSIQFIYSEFLSKLALPMNLKEYQIINKLGAGSFGVVYRAKNKKTSEISVIKEIQMSKLDARLKKWAMNEAKLMKQINSPYIVKYYTSFIENNKLYISMQFCPKGDLCKYLKCQMGKPIKQQTIWRLTIQIMIGLRDLHQKKILHRDIKTLNIFLDQNYNVRIGDLGVAKTMSTQFTNTIVGTPYYLSPQMCEQKPYNQKTDIWAFGCLIYELCTFRHPFQAQNQAALALKIVMGKFQDIPSFYSKDLRWIIQSCLSVDYKRRPTISYILARPRVIEQANKLNITLEIGSKILKQKDKLQPQVKQIKKQVEIRQLVSNATKKVQQAVQNINKSSSKQKPIINQQIKPKYQVKVPHQNIYNQKQLQIVKKSSRESQQKRKIIDVKKGNLPPKQFVRQEQKKYIQKNNSSKQLNKKISKQKIVKIVNPPPAKVIANDKCTPLTAKMPSLNNKINSLEQNPPKKWNKQRIPSTKQTEKSQQIVPQKEISSNSQYSSNNLKERGFSNFVQKRKSVPSSHLEYIQRSSIKRQIDYEDRQKNRLQQSKEESQIILNLSILDITKKKQNSKEQQIIKEKKKSEIQAKKNSFVSNNIQKQFDDDMLLAEFGITPEKKQILSSNATCSMLSMKTKSINWDLQLPQTSNLNITKITEFKELPTVKGSDDIQDHEGKVSILQGNNIKKGVASNNQNNANQDYNEDYVQQQEDNIPYKSDDQDQSQKENAYKIKQKQPKQKCSPQKISSSSEEDSRYLIENIEAQFQQQGRKSLLQSIQLYSKRQLQNQKRLIHLQNLKSHTQKQYFSHLNKEVYNKLKQKINSEEDDKEVDKLMKELTKGKQQLVMKYLKIVGYQMEIQMCSKNVQDCKEKIKQMKIKIQKGQII